MQLLQGLQSIVKKFVSDGQTFDFVIIGGGSAGCVLANRLTEIHNWTVLMIEAGDYPSYASESAGISVLTSPALSNWDFYTTENKISHKEQKHGDVHLLEGKMLGGSSSNNYMYYVRGNAEDYNEWSRIGNKGWDWQNVLTYFKKSEGLRDTTILDSNSGSLHNTDGYLGVTRYIWDDGASQMLESFAESGHKILDDLNGHEQIGYGFPQFTIDSGIRQSSAVSFIKPIKDRQNLYILRKSVARRILFDDENNAIGVEIKNDIGKIIRVNANKEVILSAGSIKSPQLLMLSGVGPKNHLDERGIHIIYDSPEVGANLQDHKLVPLLLTGEKSGFSIFKNFKALNNLDKFPEINLMGFVALNKNQTYPDYQVTAFPFSTGSLYTTLMCTEVFKWNDEVCMAIADSSAQDIFYALIVLLHPKSKGVIRLKSNNADDQPIIDLGYFSNAADIETLANCIEDYLKVSNTTYFRNIKSILVDLNVKHCEGMTFASHEYWRCYSVAMAASQFHPAGTCAMGPNGVVDDRLRVHGVNRLRIVDASIMPTMTSGNINAPVIMIAEKASDFIKFDHGITE
ncbi:unnamed protein product [Leptidea sinapis]|uniref:Glucose-methanol-choline oxidoreductase N-terminal domain-containing protein n=1 Tax=Leptidea sinapis TaxID=189913 RepID=A0A5E4QIU8_9NEOP|nr:unnamed protein product [Leptidea sinapis]